MIYSMLAVWYITHGPLRVTKHKHWSQPSAFFSLHKTQQASNSLTLVAGNGTTLNGFFDTREDRFIFSIKTHFSYYIIAIDLSGCSCKMYKPWRDLHLPPFLFW